MATRSSPSNGRATAMSLLLLSVLLCGSAPWLATADWGPPGNVVPNFVNPGPPLSCLPHYSRLNLDSEYDVFDKLHFNQIINLAVSAGSSPYVAQLSSWALVGWNAVALYDCSAVPALDLGIPRRPPSQRTLRNRNKALAAALLRFHEKIDPILGASSRQILADSLPAGPKSKFNLAPNCTGSGANDIPECVGIKAAEVTYTWMIEAGWNYDGALSRQYNRAPYTDYTGYTPKNSPWDLTHPCNWQPLHETDRRGKTWIQTHLLPYGENIKTFLVDKQKEGARTVDMWNCSNPDEYKAQVDEVLTFSAALAQNDTLKMQAELLGPQPFCLITILMLRQTKGWTITDVMAFNLMSIVMIDLQTSVMMREKRRHDAVRPASAVRYLYGTSTVKAYAGPAAGTQTFPGKDWLPYLETFNEAEFPSGAVCWCTVLNEWIELWQGGDSNPNSGVFEPPLTFSFQPGCSLREPYISPKQPTSFTIRTTKEYIQRCQDARVIGGVHFRKSVEAGYTACTGASRSVWGKVKALYPKLAGKTCSS